MNQSNFGAEGRSGPFTGMVADRFGSMRVLFIGCLLYGAGIYFMAHAHTAIDLALSAGVIVGMALSTSSILQSRRTE